MPKNPVQTKQIPSVGVNKKQATDLLCQALEAKLGCVHVYEAAILAAQNANLRKEWETHRDRTRNHVRILRGVFAELGLDPETETPGRNAVHDIGSCLFQAMMKARRESSEEAAQLVAAECVILAETRIHFNRGLLGELANSLKGAEGKTLKSAYDAMEMEHLDYTMGWARGLWLKSLGLPALLPPTEERKDVKIAAVGVGPRQIAADGSAGTDKAEPSFIMGRKTRAASETLPRANA